MLGKKFVRKYLDLGNLVVDVYINKRLIQNTLIDLRASINVMTKDTMFRLGLKEPLRCTPIILQLADKSTLNPEGVLEDVMVFVDSREYPTYFIVLQTKSKLNGYPLILGRT
jgi:hypothetical protein